MAEEKLFSEFPPVTTEDWKAKIEKDLKGTPFERLIWKTGQGFEMQPFYRSSDLKKVSLPLQALPGDVPFLRGKKADGNHWKIASEIDCKEPKEALQRAKEAIEHGVSALVLYLDSDYGISVNSSSDLEPIGRLCSEKSVELHFRTEGLSAILASELKVPANLSGSWGVSPLEWATKNGKWNAAYSKLLSELLQKSEKDSPNMRLLGIDSSLFQTAGARTVDEIAYVLSQFSDYANLFLENGLSLDSLCKNTVINLSVSSSYFPEITKFRSIRILLSRILEVYGAHPSAASDLRIHASTSRWNMTAYDPYTNMLRATTEAMSASIGGADLICVLPFDSALDRSSSFSSRIARNVQHLLQNESHLDKVVDPAGGSYFLESLTESICEHSWAIFQSLEKEGGYLESLKKGVLQKRLSDALSERKKSLNQRKEILLGTNQYPNSQDTLESKRVASEKKNEPASMNPSAPLQSISALASSRKWSELENSIPLSGETITESTVQAHRLSEDFEGLRQKSQSGSFSKKILLLPLGKPAMRQARTIFAQNFLNCGGFEVLDPGPLDSPNKAIEVTRSEKPQGVVLCSSDEEYPEFMESVIQKLKSEFPNLLCILAGEAGENEKMFIQSGIQKFIHRKSNVFETLQEIQSQLEASR